MTQPDLFTPPHVPTDLELAFSKFHRENPQVWKIFREYALIAIARGHKHYGAKTIFEAIRFHTDMQIKGDIFKLNNNLPPYYSRLFMQTYPEHQGFFETRKVKEEEG